MQAGLILRPYCSAATLTFSRRGNGRTTLFGVLYGDQGPRLRIDVHLFQAPVLVFELLYFGHQRRLLPNLARYL